ncbi:Sau3AI family type II restriction endonuclease [Sporosarcina siberiensis]|uniref:Sau3AI family type II restriction endonuclease n=1 Tax=Sporosarcina siberiensis TaxID=1365606 RepID=A0ABW4SF63_9BACL
MIYETEEALMYKAKQAEGKSFGEIDKSGRIENEKAKGQLGQIVEESFFGYEINSKSEPDFAHLGIELKVTPVKRNKNGTFSAKERLVLNIINYHLEVKSSFYESSFWKKNEEILIMFYEWIPIVKRANYRIIKSYLHNFTEEDLEIIKQDWYLISSKIKAGLAHELSEADTNYLAASTKGANKSSLRSQPFSDELAMQRAFSLKQSYMTALFRKVISSDELISFATPQDLKVKSLEQLLIEKFASYVGMTLEKISLKADVSINHKSKSFLQQFVSQLLGIRGTKLNQIAEFAKANIHVKTIRLEPNGVPKEHMSFKNIDFHEWANEDWDESWLKNHFEETKFLFVVFQYKETFEKNPQRQLYFNGVLLWNMPLRKIDGQLYDFWKNLQSLINNGIELIPVQQKENIIVRNNLPKPGHNSFCHIRPKARNASDKTVLPDGQLITKQAFWLDNKYIGSLINGN